MSLGCTPVGRVPLVVRSVRPFPRGLRGPVGCGRYAGIVASVVLLVSLVMDQFVLVSGFLIETEISWVLRKRVELEVLMLALILAPKTAVVW